MTKPNIISVLGGPSITDLTQRLAKTCELYDLADHGACDAFQPNDLARRDARDKEMRRLAKAKQKLRRKICEGFPMSADEALMQIVIAAEFLDDIVAGVAGRRALRRAEAAVSSALRFLIPSLRATLPELLTDWVLRDPAEADRAIAEGG